LPCYTVLVRWQGDLANIKGGMPTIRNLMMMPPPARRACTLSRAHKEAIRSVSRSFSGDNSSCVWNETLSMIIEG
jgi:hypothetical protein